MICKHNDWLYNEIWHNVFVVAIVDIKIATSIYQNGIMVLWPILWMIHQIKQIPTMINISYPVS